MAKIKLKVSKILFTDRAKTKFKQLRMGKVPVHFWAYYYDQNGGRHKIGEQTKDFDPGQRSFRTPNALECVVEVGDMEKIKVAVHGRIKAPSIEDQEFTVTSTLNKKRKKILTTEGDYELSTPYWTATVLVELIEPLSPLSEETDESFEEEQDSTNPTSSCGGGAKRRPAPVEQPEEDEEEEEEPRNCAACTGYIDASTSSGRWKCEDLVPFVIPPEDSSKYKIQGYGDDGYDVIQWTNSIYGTSVGTWVSSSVEGATEATKATFEGAATGIGAVGVGLSSIEFLRKVKVCFQTGLKLHRLRKVDVGDGVALPTVDDEEEEEEWSSEQEQLENEANEAVIDAVAIATDMPPDKARKNLLKYVKKKKKRKLARAGFGAGMAALGIAGAAIGLAVSGPVGWGIALGIGIVGLTAAIGTAIYRWRRSVRQEQKRQERAERRAHWVKRCLKEEQAPDKLKPPAHKVNNWAARKQGVDPDLLTKDQLAEQLLHRERGEREMMSFTFIQMFMSENKLAVESDSKHPDIDGFCYRMLYAIGVSRKKMYRRFREAYNNRDVDPEDMKEFVSHYLEKIMRKFSSW